MVEEGKEGRQGKNKGVMGINMEKREGKGEECKGEKANKGQREAHEKE